MKIAIAGAGGKMGRTLIEAVQGDPSLTLAAAFDIGDDIARAVASCDALVDFTRPEGTLQHLDACLAAGKSIVIGTTGFSPEQKARIDAAAKRIPVMLSPNFAVGVNVVFKLAEVAAKALGEGYDIEVIEAHHRQKVDAPSGTALEIGRILARALGRDRGQVAAHGREGDTGARP
ncbi:MAG: 4-hydroxy-tetrahydrodipicolinate reductase, partial [Fimbriimonadaceae bacterium]